MEHLIDKYLRKHIRVEGNELHYDINIVEKLRDIFDEPTFDVKVWAEKNVADEFILHITNNGFPCLTAWVKGHKFHRLDGPAITISYESNGGQQQIYYIEGEQLSKEGYDARIN